MPHDQVKILVGPRIINIASFGRDMQMIFNAQVQMQSPSFSGGVLPALNLRHAFKPRQFDQDLHDTILHHHTGQHLQELRNALRASS